MKTVWIITRNEMYPESLVELEQESTTIMGCYTNMDRAHQVMDNMEETELRECNEDVGMDDPTVTLTDLSIRYTCMEYPLVVGK